MINVAQGWAEAYAEVAPEVSVEVAGGGSGVGIAALIDGTVQIANSSRPLKPDEMAKARGHHGVDPVEIVAGYDALAVFVHRNNPVDRLTLAQIQAIFAEQGTLLRWSDLGVANRHVHATRSSASAVNRAPAPTISFAKWPSVATTSSSAPWS